MEYYKTPSGIEKSEFIALYKNKTTKGVRISGQPEERSDQTIAIAYAPISYQGVIYYNFRDYMRANFPDLSDEEFEIMFSTLPKITKEEFYDLNNI